MTRIVHVRLTGLARGGDLLAVVSLSTIRPHCIDYSLAKVDVDVDGDEVSHEVVAITETSALTSMAQWLIARFGAKAASINREPKPEVLSPADASISHGPQAVSGGAFRPIVPRVVGS